jgi:predicted nucleic acid-binding protein
MIVVCDSSPVIALALCDCLPLLDTLFHEVGIPHRVYEEMTISGKPEAKKIAAWGQGKAAAVKDMRLRNAFGLVLDAGESEAMALYWEKGADFLLIDEKKGRTIAIQSGMQITGSLGVFALLLEVH